MHHVSTALFTDEAASRAALAKVLALDVPRDDCSVITADQKVDTERLTEMRSAAREGLPAGLLVGAVLGAIGGVEIFGTRVASTVGLLTVAGAGAVFCGAVGALVGVSAPRASFERQVTHLEPGEILLVVESHDLTLHENIDRALRESGGRAVE